LTKEHVVRQEDLPAEFIFKLGLDQIFSFLNEDPLIVEGNSKLILKVVPCIKTVAVIFCHISYLKLDFERLYDVDQVLSFVGVKVFVDGNNIYSTWLVSGLQESLLIYLTKLVRRPNVI
jgi:hypothetical protein